jgi:hypothetical protein
MHDFIIQLSQKKDKGLSISDCANIIIAGVNLLLAFYIFIYQRNKDKKSDFNIAKLNEQTINLQWFKELIIQPHINSFIESYRKLINFVPDFVPPGNANYTDKIDGYVVFLKEQLFPLSKNFISLFETVDPKLHKSAIAIIDEVIETITLKLIDNEIDLSLVENYESIILKEIINSKNKMIKLIYTYKAINV